MAKPMVLVVDNQPEYSRLICQSLASEGFDVRAAADGESGISAASELHPDVILLDLDMPDHDGSHVLAELRQRWPVPIIALSADTPGRGPTSGLDQGADDYVSKPFSPRELVARVRALLRRTGGLIATGVGAKRLRVPPMDRRSARLLELFTANPDKVLYHDELLAHAFGPAFVGDSGSLHEQIRRVRRALGVAPGAEGPIRTVKGVGYSFDPSGGAPSPTRRQQAASPTTATRG